MSDEIQTAIGRKLLRHLFQAWNVDDRPGVGEDYREYIRTHPVPLVREQHEPDVFAAPPRQKRKKRKQIK
jgi:hypothetical protein